MYGDVKLVEVDNSSKLYSITVSTNRQVANKVSFTPQGKYIDDGECLLFPSKNMRDWEKFAWKRGDVLKDSNGMECMFDGWSEDDYTRFNTIFSIYTDSNKEQHFYEDKILNTEDFYRLEETRTQRRFIKSLEDKYGGTFNPETLEMEKPKPTFKDGDFVYTEVKGGYEVISIFKEFSDENRFLIYAGKLLNGECTTHFADGPEDYNILCDYDEIKEMRLATEEEKQIILSSLEKIGKNWNPYTKRIEDLPKECEFKPFQKVLVRDDNEEAWRIAFFSHIENIDPNYPYYVLGQNSNKWAQCIPYEGNEELFGTSNKPKE